MRRYDQKEAKIVDSRRSGGGEGGGRDDRCVVAFVSSEVNPGPTTTAPETPVLIVNPITETCKMQAEVPLGRQTPYRGVCLQPVVLHIAADFD